MAAINPSNVILLVISFPSTFSQRIVIIKHEKGEGNVINSSMFYPCVGEKWMRNWTRNGHDFRVKLTRICSRWS